MTRAVSTYEAQNTDRALFSNAIINGRKYRYFINREYEKSLLNGTKYFSCYAEGYNEKLKEWREVLYEGRISQLYKLDNNK